MELLVGRRTLLREQRLLREGREGDAVDGIDAILASGNHELIVLHLAIDVDGGQEHRRDLALALADLLQLAVIAHCGLAVGEHDAQLVTGTHEGHTRLHHNAALHDLRCEVEGVGRDQVDELVGVDGRETSLRLHHVELLVLDGDDVLDLGVSQNLDLPLAVDALREAVGTPLHFALLENSAGRELSSSRQEGVEHLAEVLNLLVGECGWQSLDLEVDRAIRQSDRFDQTLVVGRLLDVANRPGGAGCVTIVFHVERQLSDGRAIELAGLAVDVDVANRDDGEQADVVEEVHVGILFGCQ